MAKIMGGVTATNMPVPDWEQTNPLKADYIKNKPDISGKVDKVPQATGGNLAVFTMPEGNIADCGISCAELVTTKNIGNFATNTEKAESFDTETGQLPVYGSVTVNAPKDQAGLSIRKGDIRIFPATEAQIEYQVQNPGVDVGFCTPIVPKTVNLAVKMGLSYNHLTLTDAEKQAARTLIGAAAIDTLGDISEALDHIIALQESIMGGDA